MNKPDRIIDCENCGKRLIIRETGNIWPGGLERENVYCPYCGQLVVSKMTSGFIEVFEFDEDN